MSSNREIVFEWDRPNTGLYSGNRIRIITERMPDGTIGACTMATPEQVLWIMQYELMTEMNNNIKKLIKLEESKRPNYCGGPG